MTSRAFDTTRWEAAVGVGTITLDRPDRFNGEITTMLREVHELTKADDVEAESMGFGELIAVETAAHGTTATSADSEEAFSPFVEKRAPRFHGT